LSALAKIAERHDLWLVADEVYAGLAPGGQQASLAARLPEQVVTVGSLSKTHAMTGWRCGWLIGPQQLVAHAESVAMCMLFGSAGLHSGGGARCAGGPHRKRRAESANCAKRGARCCCVLCRMREGFVWSTPEAGMFLLVDVRGTGLSGRELTRALYEKQRVCVMGRRRIRARDRRLCAHLLRDR